jgi:hypothetical protein
MTISTKQTEIKTTIEAADNQLVVLGNKMEELNLGTDDQELAESTESKAEALRAARGRTKSAKRVTEAAR